MFFHVRLIAFFLLFLTFTQSFPKVDPAKSLSFLQFNISLSTLPASLPSPIIAVEVSLCVVGASVVGASVVGNSSLKLYVTDVASDSLPPLTDFTDIV